MSLFPTNKDLKIEQIASAGDYILFKHLNKNLIEVDAQGRIYGDLAENWSINSKNTKFTFKLRENIFFSDATPIQSKDVKYSFDDLKNKKGGIHFDFNQIKKINIKTNVEFEIELKTPNPRFLRGLAHPEFGIRKSNNNKIEDTTTTSGCYRLTSNETGSTILEKNNNCNDFQNSFKKISFSFVRPEEQKKSILNQEKDFYISFMNNSELQEVLAKNKYDIEKPHIGFTYWITLNTKKNTFSSRANRKAISALFSQKFNIKEEFDTERAKQLYLPNGPGRLSDKEISKISYNNKVESKKLNKMTLSILLPKNFDLNSKIVSILEENTKKLKISYYNNQKDFIDQKYNNFDLFVTNNDFSSLDLYENIFVTFNSKRPLIYKNLKISNILREIKKTVDEESLYSQYKKIGHHVLNDNLIIPLIHKKIIFVKKKNIDLSDWSNLFPEVSAWKIKIKN